MAYIKHAWVDKEDPAFDPNSDPKLEADNLNEMEDGIGDANTHVSNTSNPHSVTKAQVGLANVDNTSDASKPISAPTQQALDAKEDYLGLPLVEQQMLVGYLNGDRKWEPVPPSTIDHFDLLNKGTYTHAQLDTHIVNTFNPHAVNKEQVGLGNADNTSDLDKPISTATQQALDTKEDDLGTALASGQVLTGYVNGDMKWENPVTGVTNHYLMSNIGLNTHYDIDDHIASGANPHFTTIQNLSDTDVDTPTEGQRLSWNETTMMWEPRNSVSGLGFIVFDYLFDTDTDATPADGRVQINNVDPALADMLYFHENNRQGANIDAYWAEIKEGDWFNLYRSNDTSRHYSYDVTGPSSKVGTTWTIPVISYLVEGAPLADNNRVKVLWRVSQTQVIDNLVTQRADWSLSANMGYELRLTDEKKTEWKGTWVPNTYESQNMVVDGAWTMIANKQTADRAAPQNDGEPSFDMPDLPVWVSASHTGVVRTGNKYTLTKPGWFTRLEVWVPEVTVDTTYRMIIANETDPANIVGKVVALPNLLPNQWNVVEALYLPYGVGTIMSTYLDSINSGSSTQVTGGWARGANNNNSNPALSNWNRNNQSNILRISTTDLDTTSRETELMSITNGSTIQFADSVESTQSVTYYVTDDPILDVDTVIYGVAVDNTGIGGEPEVGNPTAMTANVPVPQASKYVEIENFRTDVPTDWADVVGLLSLDGVPVADTDDGYGVRVEFQPAYVSPDWDIVASTEGGGGGGGETTFASEQEVLEGTVLDKAVSPNTLNVKVPTYTIPTDGLALVNRETGNAWEKILGLPIETGNAYKTVTTNGNEGDSFWSPFVTSPNTVTEDYAITAGSSASIVSPTIDDGVTITIPDGSILVIL